MMQPDCTGLDPLPSTPLPQDVGFDPSAAATWAIISIFIFVLIFDIWALSTGHHTISQRVQHLSRDFKWLKWIGITGLIFLGWHLFWGFPW